MSKYTNFARFTAPSNIKAKPVAFIFVKTGSEFISI
jgi:hypothetical protein